ncbi:DUF305 domain-containing protein [Thermobifida halotolerans]|uniref:DUF305 domain-containing protein n=2 Tax=Thermobifida halotolerans TaxID=483545 RepID=A0A399G4B8_9ACTN|nr:DUF305 domain-containing protein [Thermobifida halotolerans]
MVVAGAVLLVLGGAGCAGNGPDPVGGAPVLAPGAPGDPASPASEEQLAAAVEDAGHNDADVEYVLAMITHHEQALEMTELVPDRARDEGVRSLAERIEAAQRPEIELMEGWLETYVDDTELQRHCGGHEGGSHHHGDGGDDCAGHGHSDMPGMATPEQMAALEDASGEEFDALFVELMVTHHEGGISMAEDVLADGNHPQVLGMANDLITDQRVEIGRLESVLDD